MSWRDRNRPCGLVGDKIVGMAAAGDPSFRGFWKPRLSDELTEREREVLALVAERHSNDGICKKLFLSPKPLRRSSGTHASPGTGEVPTSTAASSPRSPTCACERDAAQTVRAHLPRPEVAGSSPVAPARYSPANQLNVLSHQTRKLGPWSKRGPTSESQNPCKYISFSPALSSAARGSWGRCWYRRRCRPGPGATPLAVELKSCGRQDPGPASAGGDSMGGEDDA